jgi:TRAP-type C4-dicarboxylate transport system permease large subunit
VTAITLFASGLTTIVETAAAALAYAVLVEAFVTRDLPPGPRLTRALLDSAALAGAVLILMSAAMGITSYIVDAQIADAFVSWMKTHITSPGMFLLALNAMLVLAGALLDEYSAIVVLAPLVASLGAAFGVHPVHLGVVFLGNLELGYLVPPVGLCLFLAASRFGRSLVDVVRATTPFTLLMALAVLMITYLPVLTVGVLSLFGRPGPD